MNSINHKNTISETIKDLLVESLKAGVFAGVAHIGFKSIVSIAKSVKRLF